MSPTGRSPIPSCLSLPLAKSNENDKRGIWARFAYRGELWAWESQG